MPADFISIFPIQAATNCDSFDPDANLWRSQNRLIDLHQHIGDSPKHLERAISIMDQVGIGLPAEVLRKIYFDNARQLLASSLPPRRVIADRLRDDFVLSGHLDHEAWEATAVTHLDQQSSTGSVRMGVKTEIKLLWSPRYLYVGFKAPFEKLHVFDPPLIKSERIGLWEKDVVELFIGS